jgi:hypothetical protein
VVLLLAACGRIGFDPLTGATGSNQFDAHDGDGPPGGFKDAAVVPQDANLCAFAIVAPLNTRVATSTCLGHDIIDGCGPVGAQEAVFSFTPAASSGYTFRAFDPGTSNVSNSTKQLGAGCAPLAGCSGVLGIGVNVGETVYFVVEASAGGCVNIEFEVQ